MAEQQEKWAVRLEVEYFNLQGIRVQTPAKGATYIKRQGSAVSKVIF